MELIRVSIQAEGVGLLGLNHSAALNALNLEMVLELTHVLLEWRQDPRISVVVLHADSDRAFCAGGDVKSIAQEILAGKGDRRAREFFRAEYDLDRLIHEYSKPVIVWGDGIVMGGGFGLFIGASHRVVTERSVLSMPEIAIGFFPDVGGGYFLNRLPDGVGLFLGLTAARLNAADALFLGMATDVLPSTTKSEILKALESQAWVPDARANHQLVSKVLAQVAAPTNLPPSNVKMNLSEIQKRMRYDSIEGVRRAFADWHPADPWLEKCALTFRAGSPHSARVIFDHLHECDGMSLPDVFAKEWALAVEMVNHPDFCEGIRALLIDKAGDPKWAEE